MDDAAKIVIAGLGSWHGDDQVGWQVVDRVAADLSPGVSARCVSDPADLLSVLTTCQQLVMVDAVVTGRPAGTVVRLCLPQDAHHEALSHSSHGLGVTEVLELARQLGRSPRNSILIGVELKATAPLSPVSDDVERGVAQAVRLVREEIARLEELEADA